MALDRFVYFEKRVPTHDEIQVILVNYLGGCGTVSEGRPDWWLIDLPGQNTSTFKGVVGSRPDVYTRPEDKPRYIEVAFQTIEGWTPTIDVMTRHADDFTNGIAARLAEEFARFYGGRIGD